MLDFYRTVGGRRFIDHTLPDLALALHKIAFDLHRIADVLEAARREANPAPDTDEGEPR